MKKTISAFMAAVLLMLLPCFAVADDNGGAYGDNNATVEDNLSDEYITSDSLKVKGGYIAVPSTRLTVGYVLSNLKDSANISAYSADGDVLADSDTVMTGDVFKLIKGSVLLDTVTAAVKGDFSGNGKITVSDIATLANSVIKGNSDIPNMFCGDFNNDGKLSVYDVILMRYKMLEPENTDAYDQAAYNAAIWNSDVVYQENAAVIKKNGVIENLGFIYKPDRIIAVRSYDLKTLYVEGKDYVLTSDGKLSIPNGSSIPSVDYSRFFTTPYTDGNSWLNGYDKDGTRGGVVNWGSAGEIHNYQISVTYTHSDKWNGIVPTNQIDKLPSLKSKLQNGEKVTAVFYGDSITAGWNASGMYETETYIYNNGNPRKRTSREVEARNINGKYTTIAPYAPSWPRAVTQELQDKYPKANVEYHNLSCSSSNSANFGIKYTDAVIAENPDVVFLGFGTNEAGRGKDQFKIDTLTIMEAIKAKRPDCAFVLVSAEVPNENVDQYKKGNLDKFEQAYYELQAENKNIQIAVAPVNKVSRYVNSKKRFEDITGNNINHPNDFGVRVYISTLMQTLGLYD